MNLTWRGRPPRRNRDPAMLGCSDSAPCYPTACQHWGPRFFCEVNFDGGGSLAERSAFWATCSCAWRNKSSRARAPSSSPHAPRRRRPRAETRELVRRPEEQGPFEPVGRLTARLPAPFSSLTATTGRLVGPRGWRPTPRCSRRRAPPLRCARRLALLGRTAPLGR